MTIRGASTKERILDAAHLQVIEGGFASTSIENVISAVGITKGSFFHHFKTKADLARALIDRFAAADRDLMQSSLARAEKLSRDPLQQLLIFVGLILEYAESIEDPYPGCLFASYTYEANQFNDDTMAVVSQALLDWRAMMADKIRAAMTSHPPRREVDPDALADMLTVIFEGAFVYARAFHDPKVFGQQLRQYRDYLELVFGVDD